MSLPSDSNIPTKDNPYASEMLVNRLMTEGSDKETWHFELSLKESGLNYLPGDSLGGAYELRGSSWRLTKCSWIEWRETSSDWGR